MAKAKEHKAVDVNIAPGQELHIHVTRDGEEVAHYMARVDVDSLQPVFHAAPPPAEPVQDPDPWQLGEGRQEAGEVTKGLTFEAQVWGDLPSSCDWPACTGSVLETTVEGDDLRSGRCDRCGLRYVVIGPPPAGAGQERVN
jgi:hypothetical protein